MKKIIFSFSIILLVSCGPSPQEKEEIATITCNILSASGVMDASMRIKEINLAREKIKADAFLGTDVEISEAFEYGICYLLVLNDPDYTSKLLKLKERREAEEKRRQAARITRLKIVEEARITLEKLNKEQGL